MADTSPILSLPYIQPSQAQKHVTHNEALSLLDLSVQLVVEAIGSTTPPTLPAEGEAHVTGTGATGAWAGQDMQIAWFAEEAWRFIAPKEGWRVWDKAAGQLRVYLGGSWGLPPAETQNLDHVGVNTTADATNRLAVASPATLLTHDGGGHQLKVNKAAVADTASLLFQTNWSGRAEMGLTGEDDFSIKVSDDGSTWTTPLCVGAATGNVGIGTTQPGYPLTVTASGTNAPIAMRLQNFSGEASTIATTRGLVLSADHDDNSAGAQSFIGLEVDAAEVARFGANGAITLGRAAGASTVQISDVLNITPGSAPVSPNPGDIYFDSAAAKLRCWDGTVWQDLF